MHTIPDDVIKYVILGFLLPKDILQFVKVSKYYLNQITDINYKFHYYNYSILCNKLFNELKTSKKCIAYIYGDPEFIDGVLTRIDWGKNIKCKKNRNYNSSFCSRHEKIWYENDTTDEWWVPLQM